MSARITVLTKNFPLKHLLFMGNLLTDFGFGNFLRYAFVLVLFQRGGKDLVDPGDPKRCASGPGVW